MTFKYKREKAQEFVLCILKCVGFCPTGNTEHWYGHTHICYDKKINKYLSGCVFNVTCSVQSTTLATLTGRVCLNTVLFGER